MNQEKIGLFIEERRKAKELTQEQLGQAIGVSKSLISTWEHGKNIPSSKVITKLCQELDISVNELISGELLEDHNYIEKAEDNLVKLKELDESNNRLLLNLKTIILSISTTAFIVMLLIGVIAESELLYRVILIITGILVFIVGIFYSFKIDKEVYGETEQKN